MMKKIAIVGCAGSGKSFLGAQLNKTLKLPWYNLDKFYWKAGWQKPIHEEFAKVHDELVSRNEWIIEGPYRKWIESRFEHADTIIVLDFPRYKCFYYVFKRAISNWGRITSNNPENCPEGLSIEFLLWIWNYDKKYKKFIETLLEKYSESKKVYIFKSRNEVNLFIEKLNLCKLKINF